jgi:hypothetical protein
MRSPPGAETARDLAGMLAAQTRTPVPDLDALTSALLAAHALHGLTDDE